MARWRELANRWVDVALDVVLACLAVGAQVEVWTSQYAERRPLLAILTLVWTLAPFGRRRFPLGAPIVALGALAASSFVADQFVANTTTTFIGAVILTWITAAYNEPRRAVLGLAAALALVATVVANDPEGAAVDGFVVSLVVLASWAVGLSWHRQTRHAAQLEERAERAERERETAARIAVAEERSRIARELHDVVAHSVSVMVLQASAARRRLSPDQTSERDALLTVERTGREALGEMRRLLGVMRDEGDAADLTPQPGLGHVETLVAQTREAGLPVELRVEGTATELPAGIDLSAYRIVQEGLTNALKHAGPARAVVVVRYLEDAVEVEVADDGRGPASANGAGHGLVGIRERVKLYRGEIETGPREGGGYVLRARLPVGTADS